MSSANLLFHFILTAMIHNASSDHNTLSDYIASLYQACWIRDVDKVKKLLSQNYKNELGWTLLMMASYDGLLEMVRILLDNKASVHIQDEFGYTALLLASAEGHVDASKLLLDNDADINQQNERG